MQAACRWGAPCPPPPNGCSSIQSACRRHGMQSACRLAACRKGELCPPPPQKVQRHEAGACRRHACGARCVHAEGPDDLQEALPMCDLLLYHLVELGFAFSPAKSAMLLQLHGGSAQKTRGRLTCRRDGVKYIQLPSGRLVSLRNRKSLCRDRNIIPRL